MSHTEPLCFLELLAPKQVRAPLDSSCSARYNCELYCMSQTARVSDANVGASVRHRQGSSTRQLRLLADEWTSSETAWQESPSWGLSAVGRLDRSIDVAMDKVSFLFFFRGEMTMWA